MEQQLSAPERVQQALTAANVDATAEEIRLELSDGDTNAAAAAARSNGQGVGDDAPAVGLEERVVRLERAMTTTLDLLQQMRQSQASLKPLDPLNS